LREACITIFTKENIFPLVDAMEKRLEEEMPIRARIRHEDPAQALLNSAPLFSRFAIRSSTVENSFSTNWTSPNDKPVIVRP
jgi:hypothetical protein